MGNAGDLVPNPLMPGGIPLRGLFPNAPSEAGLAGNPFGSQFVVPQRGIRGMTPAQVEELKQWDPQSGPTIDNIYRNVKPGGPQLPLAYLNNQVPMGNAGAIAMI